LGGLVIYFIKNCHGLNLKIKKKCIFVKNIKNMNSTIIQFIIDAKGEKLAAVIPMKIYAKMLERLEELEDIELYDAVKARQEPSISLEAYRQERQKRKQETYALSSTNR
jgi:hypothetical protein